MSATTVRRSFRYIYAATHTTPEQRSSNEPVRQNGKGKRLLLEKSTRIWLRKTTAAPNGCVSRVTSSQPPAASLHPEGEGTTANSSASSTVHGSRAEACMDAWADASYIDTYIHTYIHPCIQTDRQQRWLLYLCQLATNRKSDDALLASRGRVVTGEIPDGAPSYGEEHLQRKITYKVMGPRNSSPCST